MQLYPAAGVQALPADFPRLRLLMLQVFVGYHPSLLLSLWPQRQAKATPLHGIAVHTKHYFSCYKVQDDFETPVYPVGSKHVGYITHYKPCVTTALSASGCSPRFISHPSSSCTQRPFISPCSCCSAVRVRQMACAGSCATLNIADSSSSPADCSKTESVDRKL